MIGEVLMSYNGKLVIPGVNYPYQKDGKLAHIESDAPLARSSCGASWRPGTKQHHHQASTTNAAAAAAEGFAI